MSRLYLNLFRYCDIVVVDALYAVAPFMNTVLEQNKDILVKVKQENREIIKDAEGLFKCREPDLVLKNVKVHKEAEASYDVKIWDEEGFRVWSGVKRPLRCLKIEETRLKNGRIEETYTEYLVTSCPRRECSTCHVAVNGHCVQPVWAFLSPGT
jgi:hypothetical protein